LQWLLRYSFQRVEDLVVATGCSNATMYRHVETLQGLGVIESVSPAVLGMASCHLYHLSNLGLHVLAAFEQTDPINLAQAWGGHEHGLLRLLPRLASLVIVQQCINGLVTCAPRALGHLGRKSEVRWHWVRDYAHRFSYRERETRCAADAVLLLRLHPARQSEVAQAQEERWYMMFLLLDSAIDDSDLLVKRLKRLLCYRECAERWPVYQHFPPVLALVSAGYREEHWQRSAGEASASLQAGPLVGAIVRLSEERDPLSGDPWRWAWKSLSTGVPCRLQDLLRPLPKEAMPPGLLDQRPVEKKSATEISTGKSAIATSRRPIRLIRCNFMQRTEYVLKEAGNGRDEQETVALLGLSLSRRQQEILELIFLHPFLNVHEMAALLNLQRSSVERYLRDLCHSGCVNPVSTHLGERWRLGERGLSLVAAMHHQSMRSIAVPASNSSNEERESLVQRGVDDLLRHLDHTVGIYGFFASLSLAARHENTVRGERRLLWWEMGASCERRYRDHDHWHNLRPDAVGEYQAGEQRVRFWLEWDRGTMGVRDLAAKFNTYAHYVASKEWFKEQRVIPSLLVVTADVGQEMRVIRIATAVLAQAPGLIVRTTTAIRLTNQGPLGAIWCRLLPESRVGTREIAQRCAFY
jgi:DNA-binding IclR family transcriptional regulator